LFAKQDILSKAEETTAVNYDCKIVYCSGT